MILIGDGVAYSGAGAELTRVAEILGAEVWGVDSGELNMSYAHPLYQGQTGHMFGPHSLPIVSRGDVVLIVGTYVLPEVFPELGDIFAPDATVIHIDLNAYEIAKSHRVDLGVTADPRLTLDAAGSRAGGDADRPAARGRRDTGDRVRGRQDRGGRRATGHGRGGQGCDPAPIRDVRVGAGPPGAIRRHRVR